MSEYAWLKSYPTGLSWTTPFPSPVPIESFFEDACDKYPDKPALDFYGRSFTFQELKQLTARTAKGLQNLGVGRGVHVGLHLPNTPHYIICFFGVLMAGGCVVNFSPFSAQREIQDQLADSDTQLMITLGLERFYRVIGALNGTAKLRTIVVCSLDDFAPAPIVPGFSGPPAKRLLGLGKELDFVQLVANDGAYQHSVRDQLQDDIAVLQYTGGTTGEPKGAMLTHANFSAVVNAFNRWGWGDNTHTRLAVLPLFHIYGLVCIMLMSVATGGELVLHLRFDPELVLADIARKKVTIFSGVPTLYKALVEHLKITEYDLSSLRFCASGGAPLPFEVLARFRERTGVAPYDGYGLTETVTLGTMQILGAEPRTGTVGLPAPNTLIEIVDLETGTKVLPIGEIGEICISGPQIMKGYWKKPIETEEALQGGRFHTGDIGFIDPDGYLRLVDRKKDVIHTGGHNVYPRNIEKAISEHPDVADVAVIGIPNTSMGELVKAFIVLKPNQPPFTYDALRIFLTDMLAPYEMPIEIEIRQSLPKTTIGKPTKKELLIHLTSNE